MNRHVELLMRYNEWRRGDGDIKDMPASAKEIGASIDAMLQQHDDLLTTVEKLRARLKVHYDDIAGVCIADDAMSRCKGEQG